MVEATRRTWKVLSRFPYREEALKKRGWALRLSPGRHGDELKRRIYMEPVVSVCGAGRRGNLQRAERDRAPQGHGADQFLSGGQSGPGPHPPSAEGTFGQKWVSDVQVAYKGGSGAARTPVDMPFTGKLFEAARQVYDQPMVLELTQLGAGPAACFESPGRTCPLSAWALPMEEATTTPQMKISGWKTTGRR